MNIKWISIDDKKPPIDRPLFILGTFNCHYWDLAIATLRNVGKRHGEESYFLWQCCHEQELEGGHVARDNEVFWWAEIPNAEKLEIELQKTRNAK